MNLGAGLMIVLRRNRDDTLASEVEYHCVEFRRDWTLQHLKANSSRWPICFILYISLYKA